MNTVLIPAPPEARGRHSAPCHPWHAERLDLLSVAAVHLIAGYPLPALPAPEAEGRHHAEQYVLAA